MGRGVKIAAAIGVVGWLGSIGALNPRLWIETFQRERHTLRGQLDEALAAGRRASAQAEQRLDDEVKAAFDGGGQGRRV